MLCVKEGEVTWAGWQNGYGNCVEVKHKGENAEIFYTFYAHMQNNSICVSKGQLLQEGQVVLCDRYVLSSFIFQGMDGVDYDFINDLNSRIIAPDIQIVLYASVDEIQNRKKSRLTRISNHLKISYYINRLIQ